MILPICLALLQKPQESTMSQHSSFVIGKLLPVLALASLIVFFEAATTLAQDSDGRRHYVQLTIVGQLDGDQRSITAAGKGKYLAAKFEVVFPTLPRLSREAEALAGKTVVARGTLVQCTEDGKDGTPECDRRRNPSGLFFLPVSLKEFRKADGPVSEKDHGVSVVCRGLVHTDVVALGGETTGCTLELTSDGRETWELQLSDQDAATARRANGKPVLVSGTVSVKRGIAVAERWIVTVRNLLPK